MRERGIVSLGTASDGDLARAIAAAAAGEAEAAEAELYRRFAPRVRLFGLKHLRDDMAADDLAQRVMLTVIERLRAADVREPDHIGSFILGTSRMMATTIRRTERRRQALQQQFGAGEPTVANEALGRLDLDRVEDCLRAVGERERSVLVLTFYAERASADIAGALGMTAGAVRVCRHRALAAMRECLGQRRRS